MTGSFGPEKPGSVDSPAKDVPPPMRDQRPENDEVSSAFPSFSRPAVRRCRSHEACQMFVHSPRLDATRRYLQTGWRPPEVGSSENASEFPNSCEERGIRHFLRRYPFAKSGILNRTPCLWYYSPVRGIGKAEDSSSRPCIVFLPGDSSLVLPAPRSRHGHGFRGNDRGAYASNGVCPSIHRERGGVLKYCRPVRYSPDHIIQA